MPRKLVIWLSGLRPITRFLVTWGAALLWLLVILFSVILPVVLRERAPEAPALHPWLLAAGVIAFAAGIAGNRLAAAWDRYAEQRLPTATEFFSNHSLARLAGLAIGMVCRSVAERVTDPATAASVKRIATRFENDWEAVSQSPSARRWFADVADRQLVSYVRDPQRHALHASAWIDLLRSLSPTGQNDLQHPTVEHLAYELTMRFGAALRLALQRDYTLGGAGAMGIILDVSRELLNASSMLNVNDADTLAAVDAVRLELSSAVTRTEGKLDRYHIAVRAEVAALGRALDLSSGTLAEVAERQQHQATKQNLDESTALVLAAIQALKDPVAKPAAASYSPEVLAAARQLKELGTLEQQALADTIAKRHEQADATLRKLLAGATTEAFRLLTLRGDNWYAAGEYDRAIEPYEQALALNQQSGSARTHVVYAHAFARLGDITAHCQRAIDVAEDTLRKVPPASVEWAWVQSCLGLAWRNLPTGNRAKNLANAIDAYNAAISVRTRDNDPEGWARLQHNLGNAWADMPTGNRAENLQRAIAAYEAALTVRTREKAPVEWARTQIVLGSAWADLHSGDREYNLRHAIEAFAAALQVLTPSEHARAWAAAQRNMATALAELGDMTGSEKNRQEAIDGYTAALQVDTHESNPVDWATTQNNLGTVLVELASGDRGKNVQRAINAYTAASLVRTREANPEYWASTQLNMANALRKLPTGIRTTNLRQAIDIIEMVRTEQPREANPRAWAFMHYNLAGALYELGAEDGQDTCGLLQRAIASRKAALTVLTPTDYPQLHKEVSNRLANDRAALEAAGCGATMAFDQIRPAE
jgi:tetratricopeptide (TPR) repeat protein